MVNHLKYFLLSLSTLITVLIGSAVAALETGTPLNTTPWIFRIRPTVFLPQIKEQPFDSVGGGFTEPEAGFVVGSKLRLSKDVLPEFALNYFFYPYLAAEISVFNSKHNILVNPPNGSDRFKDDFGYFKMLTTNLSLLFFMQPTPSIKTYVGGGASLIHVYNRNLGARLDTTVILDVIDPSYKKSFQNNQIKPLLQLGVDIVATKNINISFDFKQIFGEIKTKLIGATITEPAHATSIFNPRSLGLGLAFRLP